MLPCSHGFCRLCLARFMKGRSASASKGYIPALANGGKKLGCPVCKEPVPQRRASFVGSMHLENIVDLVVESLPAEQRERFKRRSRGEAA